YLYRALPWPYPRPVCGWRVIGGLGRELFPIRLFVGWEVNFVTVERFDTDRATKAAASKHRVDLAGHILCVIPTHAVRELDDVAGIVADAEKVHRCSSCVWAG